MYDIFRKHYSNWICFLIRSDLHEVVLTQNDFNSANDFNFYTYNSINLIELLKESVLKIDIYLY